MYFRKKTSGGRAYLQIVASRREGAAVRQQVITTLGRVEDLRESGQLERLLRSGARFAAKAIVVDAVAAGEATASAARRIGPALVFERLWEEAGCRKVVEDLAGARKHDFALERAVFLTVLHRLFAGGSDRAADRRGLELARHFGRGVDVIAVASMLYLDYSRQPGEWIPNQFGGHENLEAVAFIKQFNEVIHLEYPDVLTFAEEFDRLAPGLTPNLCWRLGLRPEMEHGVDA